MTKKDNKTHLKHKNLYKNIVKKIQIINKKLKIKLTEKDIIGKGHQGLVIKISKNRCIKISLGKKFLSREFACLNEINKYNIGPKVFDYYKDIDAITMEYIKGDFFEIFLKKEKSAITTLRVIYSIFDQLYTLDRLHFQKEEMHRPKKHIIITKNKKPILIDFERCKFSKKPSNVTQFIQYLTKIKDLLEKNRIFMLKKDLITLLKGYKRTYSSKNLSEIKSRLWFYPETTFERIYTITRLIPKTRLSTYSDIAKIACTKPKIVGFAMNKNPFYPIVPCHRVVANNSIGGFSKGVSLKRDLLESEKINIKQLEKFIINREELKNKYNEFLNELKNN